MHRAGHTDDGLHYIESEVSELKMTPYKWVNSSPLSDGYFKNFKSRLGPGTLADMSLRCTLRYRQLLTAEALRTIPWEPFGWKLWNEIRAKYAIASLRLRYFANDSRKGLTVALWKAFIHAYYGSRQDIDAALRACHAPVVLPLDLFSSTIPLLQSTPTRFLTILHISNQAMDLSRWMDICKLQNLRGLFVSAGIERCGMEERVAKGWANYAAEGIALAHLRTLGISTRFGEFITYRTLASLSCISSLQALLFRGFHVMDESEDHGWEFRYVYYGKSIICKCLTYDGRSDDNVAAKAVLSQEDHAAISFADLDDRIESNFSAEPGTPNSRLVVCIGTRQDKSLTEDQYPDWKSFVIAVRSQDPQTKRKLSSPTKVYQKPFKKPKVRKNMQQEVDDLLSSFQR